MSSPLRVVEMPTRSLATGRANNGDGMAEKYFLSNGDDSLRKTRGDTHHPADTIEIIEDMFKQIGERGSSSWTWFDQNSR